MVAEPAVQNGSPAVRNGTPAVQNGTPAESLDRPLDGVTSESLDRPLDGVTSECPLGLGIMTKAEEHLHVIECESTDHSTKVVLTSYLDSGASRSVCPKSFGEHFGVSVSPQSSRGEGFRTATGKRVTNLGSRRVTGVDSSGQEISMNYAVADISVALDSISQICDAGAEVNFRSNGGTINMPGGR